MFTKQFKNSKTSRLSYSDNTLSPYAGENRKKKMFTLVRRFCLLLFLAFFTIAFSACGGSDDLLEELGATRVRTIQLSPDTQEVDVEYELIDDKKIIVGLTYKDAAEYTPVKIWSAVTVKNPSGDEIASLMEPDFDNDFFNTVYLVNLYNALEIIKSVDNRNANPSKAKVRFVNACADSPALNVETDLPSRAMLFKETEFKGITDYTLIDPGDYTFIITETDTGTQPFDNVEPVTISANKIYTMIVTGTIDETDEYDFGITLFDDTGDGLSSIDLY